MTIIPITRLMFLVGCFVCTGIQLHAQSIQGSIHNPEGQPVPFASVSISNGKTTVQADANGSFRLMQPDSNTILLVSSSGYQPLHFNIKGRTMPLSLVLYPVIKQLAEVEVVSSGYQEIAKERVTGSFVKIDNATLNQQTGTNILKRLDGVTSGLAFSIGRQNTNPQQKTNITIRGLSTIEGPLDPLVVLDGFIYEGDINNINPNDVDNVTILKDATAASIWGARAGNGVIVITTKKGKLNQKLQVTLNANFIVTDKPDLMSLRLMSSADYIGLEKQFFDRGYFNSIINSRPYQAITPAVAIFLKQRNGTISAEDAAAQIDALKAIDTREQYLEHVYRKAVTQQYALSMQGGTNNHAYTFSIGYDNSISELSAASKKINIRMNNLFQPFRKLKITTGVYFTNTDMRSGNNGYGGITISGRPATYIQLADEHGNALPVPFEFRAAYTDTAGGGKLLDWNYYPLTDSKHTIDKTNLQELYVNTGIQYKLHRLFDLDLTYQYQQQVRNSELLNDVESYSTRIMINQFTQLDRANNTIQYMVPLGGIKSYSTSKTHSQTIRAQLNFNWNRANHALTAIAGAETRYVSIEGNSSRIYGYNADPLQGTVADYMTDYRTYVTGSFESIGGGVSSSATINKFASFYANASYTYKKRYSFSSSARRDGSNIFGLSTNDKWKPLWSAGTAWLISGESFYRSKALPVLRLRATYGYSGNVDLSKSAAAIGSYYSGSTANLPFIRINVINNPELRWEKIGMFNLALDFASKNNRVSGSVEYYKKTGLDLYGTTPYDYTTWGASSTVTRNVANISGKGMDITLNTVIIDRPVKWSATLLVNFNTEKTTKYNSAAATRDNGMLTGGALIRPFIGKPLYAMAAYKWGGLDSTGKAQGYLDGVLSTNYAAIFKEAQDKGFGGNILYIGPATPTIFGAFIHTLSWKGFSLSANIGYKFNYYFRKPAFAGTALVTNGAAYKDYEKRWQQRGDEAFTDIPVFTYPGNANMDRFFSAAEVNVLRADNIRLQYINVSCSLNDMIKAKLPFNNIQLYGNAANLGILWRANDQKLDPDYPASYSPSMNFTIGLRAGF